MSVTFDDITQAHGRIAPFIHRTPVYSSRIINDIVGGQLFFKCENFQKGGAFKARGAFNAVHSLDEAMVKKGVVTHSSGNHAAAVALAANSRNTIAHVVMPSNASAVKKAAVMGYGATVIECAPILADREATAEEIIRETGATFLHPYDDERVIAGQGTAALEMIEDLSKTGHSLDIVMCPVGGGGLLAGTALTARSLLPEAQVIAAEPLGADDAKRSFDAGVLIEQTAPNTIADGLLTSVGKTNFPIIMQNVDEILTVSEQSIVHAMRLIWQHMKLVVEPSAAVPLAALLSREVGLGDKKVGIILSGGNVDLDRLPW
ncbi:MAG: pyridoxal-phosphate dependent enzyme [Gammaproteobacteria bacterium]|nr:pyridoxal-phosphate dependent enzyme [Gammaproteobacteria bacterium]